MNYRNLQDFYSKGITLVELMIISVIVTILAMIIAQNFLGINDDFKFMRVDQNIRSIEGALNLYKKDVGSYPKTAETLNSLLQNMGHKNWKGPYIKPRFIVDPWGKHYVYELIDQDSYRIHSMSRK